MRKNSVKWEKLKNQRFLLMLFLSAIIITQCTTSFAIPASGEENTCPYHMEHDENCGYVEAVEGHPCSHVCDENCAVLAENCPHVHDEECGYDESLGEASCTHIHTEDCYEMITSCSHEHDETCAYVEAVEGVECGHICEACSTAGNLNLTEVFFDKNPECEEYQDVLVTFENGEDTLTGVMVKGENHSEQSALEYVLDEAGEKLTLTKKTLEMLDCGNYTVSLEMKSGVQLSFSLFVLDSREENEPETYRISTVAIDETNFPDAIFRNYVSTNFDIDHSGDLTAEEIENVTEIGLSGTAADRHQVTSLKGIEYFKNLIKLDCGFGNGGLTTLDLSANTKLQELWAVHNRLTELDISTCVNLTSIALQQENRLTELDVSHCTKLEILTCESIGLKRLILPNADEKGIYHLRVLTVHYCRLSYLNLQNYVNLSTVTIYGQGPQPLNMTLQNSSWTDTSGRKFASGTDFAGNPTTRFYKTCNSWTEGEMTDEVAFSVNASGAVTADQVLPIVNQVYFQSKIPSPPGKEYVLNGSFSYGVSGNLTENTRNLDFSEAAVTLPENVQDLVGVLGVTLGDDVTYTVTCENYEQARQGTIGSYPVTISYDQLTIGSSIEVGVSINSTNFPDTYFENWIKESVAGAADGFLTAAELDAVTEIAISGAEGKQKEYKSLQGIEYFRKLKNLYCTWGKLTELDLSKNTELLIVYAFHNSLSRVDVSGCKKLYHLEIQRNAVTELTLPVNGVLYTLYCEGNLLTKDTFDLTGQAKLKTLHCHEMRTLTEINLSRNTELKVLKCSSSALKSLDLSANTQLETLYCSRNALTELELTNNTALKNLACSYNQLTSLNVNHLTALESLECAGNHLTSLDVSGLSSDLTVDAEGQTIEKPLSMSYSDGSWKNTAMADMEPVRSFHTQGTLFYDAADQTPLDAFSVNAQGTLTATKVFDIVHSVAYESVLYDNTGMVRSGKLKGTFCYVPQYTLSAGDMMISSNAIREKLTGAADLSPLKNVSGLIVSNPDLTEIKTAVTITAGTDDFQSMKAGTAGVYTYTLTLGSSSLSGTITVYEVDLEAMIIIPATIQLTRDYIQNQAVAEGEIKLQSGTTAPGTVEISADTSVTLTGKSDSNQTIAVNVYDGANQYQGNGALASLTTPNNQKTFKLISGDVSSLKAQTYTGTMNFKIRYSEEE